jgi:competence protein ComEC
MAGTLTERNRDGKTAVRLADADRDLLPEAFNRLAPDISEDRPRPAGLYKLAAFAGRSAAFARQSFRMEADFGHLFYWTPVFLGTGAAFWFSLDRTPAVAPLLFLCVVSSLVWVLLGPFRPIARAIAMMIGLFLAGTLLAAWESVRHETTILDGPVTVTLRGIVTGKEVDSAGRWRYRIRLVETERPVLKRAPHVIRVTALGRSPGLALGEGIEGRARLSPPSGPALAGLNDFAFDAYFDGTGAFGFFYGKPTAWAVPDSARPRETYAAQTLQSLEALRGYISARIRSTLPGDTGAFAASMVTDDRRAMTKETTEALRLAGLAHIIAISGLNMALAAGLFFVGLRMLLSLSQGVSHGWPVKKIAAAGALATVTGYYLISGFAVSAERAYIMMAIMLTAVLFGRPSISLRNVSLSAIAILLISPSAVMGPGFQMSYAATLALVAGYSAWQRRDENTLPIGRISILRRFAPAWHFMIGVFMTSLIGGLSTALYSVEHFHRLAAWGLPANLLAMPVISFIVMPAGLLALVLMPFGLDWLPLAVMGYGLDIVIAIAKWAASLGGDWMVGRIPAWLFIGMTIGLLVLALMRSRLRFAGAALGAVLLLVYLPMPAAPRPDLVVFEDGSLVGLVDEKHIAVSESRPSAFIAEQWQRALRIEKLVRPERIKTAGKELQEGKYRRLSDEEIAEGRDAMVKAMAVVKPGRFTCREKHWCVGRLEKGLKIAIAENGAYAGAACDMADIVVTPARLKWQNCRSGARLFTGETLRRTGSLEFYISREGEGAASVRIVSAVEGQQRAWTLHRRYDWRTDTFEAVPDSDS